MSFVIRGKTYDITREKVENAVKGKTPSGRDGRNKFYVEFGGQQFPIKQVLHLVTGMRNGQFHAGDADRVLTKLEYEIKEWEYPPRPSFRSRQAQAPPTGNFDDQTLQEDSDFQPEAAIRPAAAARKFAVSLKSDEDGFVVVSCPALPGCHSQGRTRQEALNNITEAIRGYIASMRKHREPVPKADWEVIKVSL